jgi:hypothetical protein
VLLFSHGMPAEQLCSELCAWSAGYPLLASVLALDVVE